MDSRCTARFGGPHSPIRCDLEIGHEGDHLSKYDGWILDPPRRDARWPNGKTCETREEVEYLRRVKGVAEDVLSDLQCALEWGHEAAQPSLDNNIELLSEALKELDTREAKCG